MRGSEDDFVPSPVSLHRGGWEGGQDDFRFQNFIILLFGQAGHRVAVRQGVCAHQQGQLCRLAHSWPFSLDLDHSPSNLHIFNITQ